MNLPELWNRRLQRDFDRLFQEFSFPESRFAEKGFSPTCEVNDDEKEYCLKFDLPGIKKDDVKIEIDGNQLSVSAERREEKATDEKKGRRYSEIFYGSYHRTFSLPSTVDDKKVDANFENGVLTIRMPKTESPRAKQIAVK